MSRENKKEAISAILIIIFVSMITLVVCVFGESAVLSRNEYRLKSQFYWTTIGQPVAKVLAVQENSGQLIYTLQCPFDEKYRIVEELRDGVIPQVGETWFVKSTVWGKFYLEKRMEKQ